MGIACYSHGVKSMKTALLASILFLQSHSLLASTTESKYSNLFYAEMGKKAGDDIVVLTDSTGYKKCPSNYKYAWRGFLSLGEFKVSKGLCWMASEKSPDVTIYDPEAVIFKTSKISQDKFTKIKTEEERLAESNLASYNEMMRNLNNSNSSNRVQVDGPLILNINGNPTPCIKVGAMLDCP